MIEEMTALEADGNPVKAKRQALGLAPGELARKAGVSMQAVYCAEARRLKDADMIAGIADALGVASEDLEADIQAARARRERARARIREESRAEKARELAAKQARLASEARDIARNADRATGVVLHYGVFPLEARFPIVLRALAEVGRT